MKSIQKLIDSWDLEYRDMWLAGHDDMAAWLHDDQRISMRRAARRYLRLYGEVLSYEQYGGLVRIVENTWKPEKRLW